MFPVSEKIIQFNRGDLLASLLECGAQPFNDFSLPGSRRPGDCNQDWGTALGYDLHHALDEKSIHFGIRLSKLFVAHLLTPLEALLLLLEPFERLTAKMRQYIVCEIKCTMQEVKTTNIEVEMCLDPFLVILA